MRSPRIPGPLVYHHVSSRQIIIFYHFHSFSWWRILMYIGYNYCIFRHTQLLVFRFLSDHYCITNQVDLGAISFEASIRWAAAFLGYCYGWRRHKHLLSGRTSALICARQQQQRWWWCGDYGESAAPCIGEDHRWLGRAKDHIVSCWVEGFLSN